MKIQSLTPQFDATMFKHTWHASEVQETQLEKNESSTPPLMIIPTLYGFSFLKEISILVLVGSLDAHFQ
jgi:hypothetical protein